MLETLSTYVSLYVAIPTLLFLVLLGYLLRWWYQVSYYMYGAMVLLVAFFLGLGYLAVIRFAFSPYLVGGIYTAILVVYLAARWYHISWRDLMGRFRPTPKPT
jgi:hypothetical protein